MKLTDWIIVHEYCATRVIEGTDPEKIENRIAFIEKTPRIRVAPFTEVDDFKNWKCGDKGTSDYGMDEDSRRWCDEELLKLGYELENYVAEPSLLVPLKTLNEWVNTLESIGYTLNRKLYVDDSIKEFIQNHKE